MRLIHISLLVGMLAVSGWAEEYGIEPYSPELVKKAEAGDAIAQRSLGRYYENGNGVKINKEECLVWYTKSAEQGNADAQYDLHNYYSIKANEYIRTTDNLPRIEEARKIANEWCLKAANGGKRYAQLQLASNYFYNSRSKGAARIEELEEAKKWYTKAAEGGYKQAEKMASNCEFDIQKIQRQLKTTKSK